MSIWGVGAFENDDAADWLSELAQDLRIELIEETLDEVVDGAELAYVDVTDCCEVIAAAEVLAELYGRLGGERLLEVNAAEKLNDQLAKWTLRRRRGLIDKALLAVDHVLRDEENSELLDIWFEENDEDLVKWKKSVEDLEMRIESIEVGLK